MIKTFWKKSSQYEYRYKKKIITDLNMTGGSAGQTILLSSSFKNMSN